MSLINEALRKARQEAAEKQAEERAAGRKDGNAVYRPPRAHLPQPSKLGLGLVVGVALGVFAALGIGFVAWQLLDRPASEPEGPAVVAETKEPPAYPKAPSEPIAPEEPPAAPAATVPEPKTTEVLEDPPPAPVPVPEPLEPSPSVAAEPEPTEPEPTEPEPTEPEPTEPDPDLPKLIQPPETVGRVGNTNTYVLEADLGDTTVTLDFIVWSSSNPFAQINGKQVQVGQLVAGLLVERIERDRVVLQGSDGRIVLKVR